MHKLMGDTHGISVIVGAIMLTLIVVTAATSYAIFISDQQKRIQTAENAKLERDLENLTILALENPVYSTNPGELENISFIIANMNTDETIITSMNINNNYIRRFNLTRNGIREQYSLPYNGTGKRPIIYPREQVILTINISYNHTLSGDLLLFKNITKNDAITLHIFSSRTNDFSKTFFPPNPIIKIETEYLPLGSPPTLTPFFILDGSASDHTGDGYIVKWEWNVTNTSIPTSIYPYGQKAQIDQSFGFGFPGIRYWVNLTVTDNFGMKGTSAFRFDA